MNNKNLDFKRKVKKNALVFMMATTVVGGMGVSNVAKADYQVFNSNVQIIDKDYNNKDFNKNSFTLTGDEIIFSNGKVTLKTNDKNSKKIEDRFNEYNNNKNKFLKETGRNQIIEKLKRAKGYSDVLSIFKDGMKGKIDAETKQLIEDAITDRSNEKFRANIQAIIDKISIEQGNLTWDKLEDTPKPLH